MNFRQYEALYWIGRLGSFHAAARQLKTSQPAISARIRELEGALGIKLFERIDRKALLTTKGRELLPYAAQIMGLVADIRQHVGAREALTGRVRFGATNIHALTWVPGLIARLAASHPGILVEIAIDTSETLEDLLERGTLDVAIVAAPVRGRSLTVEPVGRVANIWVASPKLGFPAEPQTARKLARWPIISDRPGTHLHAATMEWFRAEGAEPQCHHSCSLLPTRIHLALEGIGVALAARSAVQKELDAGLLHIAPTTRPAPELSYVMTYADIGLSPCGQAVVEAVRASIAAQPTLDTYYAASRKAPLKVVSS